jgi:hypothetical protein
MVERKEEQTTYNEIEDSDPGGPTEMETKQYQIGQTGKGQILSALKWS